MRKLDKGSALLITLMVLVVLSLTGLSFIFLADTENLISNNYYRAMTTLVSAQTGVYAVNSWFNSPSRTADLVPPAAAMEFRVRSYAPDSGGAATQWKAGGATPPGLRPFDKPYVGSVGSDTVVNQFFGQEDAADVVLDINSATAAQSNYMKTLNTTLFGVTYAVGAVVPQGGGVQISQMRLYAPPMGPYPNAPTDARNQAYGICTVLVVAENINPSGQVVSTRRVRGIITDINYSVAGEALDVDGDIGINGNCRVHWGNIKSTNKMIDNQDNFIQDSGPFYVSPTGSVGYCATLMGTYDAPSDTGTMPAGGIDGDIIGDPWLLIRSRSDMQFAKRGIDANCNGDTLKWPQPGEPATRLIQYPEWDSTVNLQNYSCDYYFDTATDTLKIQSYWKCKECTGIVTDPVCGSCPTVGFAPTPAWNEGAKTNFWGCDQSVAFATAFRGYNYWKRVINSIGTQGGAASQTAHYLVPANSPAVNGICTTVDTWGPPGDSTNCKSISDWAYQQKGFWFFDTTNGTIPLGDWSNMAAGETVNGQWWAEGFIYACVKEFGFHGGAKGSFTVSYPGDPLWENSLPEFAAYRNGRYDGNVTGLAAGEYVDRFINIEYPAYPYGANMNSLNTYKANSGYEDTTRGITKGWDQYGPELTGLVGAFHGIFYLTGDLRVTGSEAFWGSVMIWNGQARTSGTIDVWYDPKLAEGLSNLGLPNSYIEQILTDM